MISYTMIEKEELKKQLDIVDYEYSIDKATLELGLDNELVLELIEEFVSQIISAKDIFLSNIDDLKNKQNSNMKLDYTELRDLAHKNLGVARNLRIDDTQKVLNELMTKDDLDYLRICVEVLEDCIEKYK